MFSLYLVSVKINKLKTIRKNDNMVQNGNKIKQKILLCFLFIPVLVFKIDFRLVKYINNNNDLNVSKYYAYMNVHGQ